MTTLSHDYATAVNARARSLGVRLVPLIRSSEPPKWLGVVSGSLGLLGLAAFLLHVWGL